MTRLAGFLRDHGGPLEADLRRVYGVDLGDLWRGTLSIRRLGVLADQLPPGSALWRSLGSDDAWDSTEHLLATVIDRLAGLTALTAGAKQYDLLPRPAQQHALAKAAENKPTGEAYTASQLERFQARQNLRKEDDE